MEESIKPDPEKDSIGVKMDVQASVRPPVPVSHPGEIILLNVGGKRYEYRLINVY